MSSLVVRVRILPESIEEDLEKLVVRIGEELKAVGTIINYKIEPIAFGLSAIIADFKIEERKGGTEPLEDKLKRVKGVSEIDVIAVSRAQVEL